MEQKKRETNQIVKHFTFEKKFFEQLHKSTNQHTFNREVRKFLLPTNGFRNIFEEKKQSHLDIYYSSFSYIYIEKKM